jgi:hypothetical protein
MPAAAAATTPTAVSFSGSRQVISATGAANSFQVVSGELGSPAARSAAASICWRPRATVAPTPCRVSGTIGGPITAESAVIAGNRIQPRTALASGYAQFADDCHAEGRGFESHQPLSKALQIAGFLSSWTRFFATARYAAVQKFEFAAANPHNRWPFSRARRSGSLVNPNFDGASVQIVSKSSRFNCSSPPSPSVP